jgi:hypothetical protein
MPAATRLAGRRSGNGFAIGWQNGPLGAARSAGAERCLCRGRDRSRANRLRYYQSSRFACPANARALAHLELALEELDARTTEREARAVEGTIRA